MNNLQQHKSNLLFDIVQNNVPKLCFSCKCRCVCLKSLNRSSSIYIKSYFEGKMSLKVHYIDLFTYCFIFVASAITALGENGEVSQWMHLLQFQV